MILDIFKALTSVRPSSAQVEEAKERAGQAPGIQEALAEPPIGVSMDWNGIVDPPGGKWMIEDGRPLSIGTYPDLYAVCGTRWNTGGESTGYFRIPDTRGRVTVGAGQGAGLTDRVAGSRFGFETHTQTTNQMPAHDHGDGTTSEATWTHDHGDGTTSEATWTHDHGDGTTDEHAHDHGGTGSNTHAHAGDTSAQATFRNVAGGTTDEVTWYINNYDEGSVNSATHAHTIPNDTHDHFIGDETWTHDHDIASEGGGQPFPLIQPSLARYTIVRVLR